MNKYQFVTTLVPFSHPRGVLILGSTGKLCLGTVLNCACIKFAFWLYMRKINTSLFSLSFALLPRANYHLSSVKYIFRCLGGPLSNRQLVPREASKVAGATDGTDSLRGSSPSPSLWAGRDRGSREVQVRASSGPAKFFKS